MPSHRSLHSGLLSTGITGLVCPEYSESGIHAILSLETQSQYQVNVFDITGRKIYSSSFNAAKGENYVHLNFQTKNQLYLISVSDGVKTETLKVSGVR